MEYSDSIITLKGIGEKTASLFQKLEILTVGDLLRNYPKDYELFAPPVSVAEAALSKTVTLELTVVKELQFKRVRNLSIGTGEAGDQTGKVTITYFNAPFMKNVLKRGGCYLMRGKLKKNGDRLSLDQPKLYTYEEYQKLTGVLQPRYALTKGLSNHTVVKAVHQALLSLKEEEFLPEDILKEYTLLPREKAFRDIHFPSDISALEEARKRLSFEEFFLFLLQIHHYKGIHTENPSDYPMIETADTSRLMEQLPYRLTNAQHQVFEEISRDLTSGMIMNRLIQGDVGSGKTVLAFLALIMTAANHYQGALMAPTEILARQHFEELCSMTEKYHLPVKPVLLTGSTTGKVRKQIYEEIADGSANVIIGTHALIQEKVVYNKLALVITDEQHRFGVRQREAFSEKGGKAHILVMSATPIPRTLAIILYGDMHLSLVDEKPVGRLPIKNAVVSTDYRKKAYEFIQKEVAAGRQAYVICPMVEENEEMEEVQDVISYTARLHQIFDQSIRTAYLHGKMKPAEKNRIMEAFAAGNIDVLVSTTVIEVGINVPNATVMMIENAERFGLAQLHQLRGRIGRGQEQSYCIFVSGNQNPETMNRLKILGQSNDGFEIAEQDLKLRGPGDLFGVRQSGEMDFQIADIYQDSRLLKQVSETVQKLLQKDPELTNPEHACLRRYLEQNALNFIDFGSI